MSSKTQYLFPRIGIVNLQTIINTDLILHQIQTYHGRYYQIFNLTNTVIFTNQKAKNNQCKFKWRGTPFSVTQTIKILARMEQYLRANKGNSVVFCVNNHDAYMFVKTIVREFIRMCRCSIVDGQDKNDKNNMISCINKKLLKLQQNLTKQHQLFSQTMFSLYKKKQISSPPVKTICSFSINTPTFIPLIQIYQQSRYNDFQLIYTHEICNDLVNYYFNLNKPLQLDKKSIGKKYYDNKPQTKYLQRPVVVCGDVKIVCYSFNTLEKVKQFQLGFNTKQIVFSQQLGENQGIVTFSYGDLFGKMQHQQQKNHNNLYNQQLQVYVKLQNWCQDQQCIYSSSCEQCKQLCKKLNLRYNQTQTQLNKLIRERNVSQVKQYFSIY